MKVKICNLKLGSQNLQPTWIGHILNAKFASHIQRACVDKEDIMDNLWHSIA